MRWTNEVGARILLTGKSEEDEVMENSKKHRSSQNSGSKK